MQNITKEETRHDVSLREDDNSVGFEANSLSQLESARESQQAEPQKVLPLAEKLCLKTVPSECPQHPEEDLQFYCFNNNHVVCAECLVKGGYTGLEISNLKRAAEKLKGKFNELLEEATTKDEACYLVQKEIAGHETKLQEVFAGYEEEVRKEMENLRQAINRKEEEMLQKISAVKEEKLKGLKDSCSKFRKFQEDIQKIKTALNDNTKGLNDANVCSYYSNISGVVKGYLNEDVNAEIEKTKRMFKYLSLQNHVQLGGFHDDAQRIEAQINNINTQVNKNKSSGSAYMIEKSEIVVKKIPLNTLLDTSVKDIKENETTQRKRISREAFISQCLNQLQPNTESSGILGRIIQGERSPSPKESSRQPSTRSPLMSEIGKYDLNKSGYMKNLFSKYGNDTKRRQDSPSAKVDLRDFFNKKSKTSARDNTLSESIVLTTRRTPRQTLQDSFLLKASKLISPRKWPADCSTDRSEQLSVLKTVPDTYHSQERTSYLKKEAKRGDLLGKNDFKKLLSASKPQRQTVDKCVLRESKLKEKLEKLSSKFFN